MEIISRNTYYKIEDDILTIAFADSDKPNPDNYLILQREVDDLEYYYYEINSQQYSGIGGFKKVEIYSNKLVIYFQEKQKIYKNTKPSSLYFFTIASLHVPLFLYMKHLLFPSFYHQADL